MKSKHNKINRRSFLRTIGATGLGSVLARARVIAGPNEPNCIDPNAAGKVQRPKFPQVPRRKLGKTGILVPCLSLGTMFNALENQIILRKSLQWGVNYWDTAYSYAGGNSELGIGKFLSKNPQVRKDVFIATKASNASTIKDVEDRLQASLKRMKTDYIDLYYGIHGMGKPEELTDELRKWGEEAKKRKVIRFFGVTIHSNMAKCLAAAAKCPWLDAVMPRYNFQYMQDGKIQAGVEACHKASIGLIAMKVQAKGVKLEVDKKLAEHFLKRGFTEGQAKVKIVLEDKRISSACLGRGNVAHLMQNIAAVLDKTKLTEGDRQAFKEYAAATCSGYCAGCAEICDAALPDTPYVSEIMRSLMYYNSYGEKDTAREVFAQIPAGVRSKLLGTDYRVAEARCLQHLPIGELVAEAVSKLA